MFWQNLPFVYTMYYKTNINYDQMGNIFNSHALGKSKSCFKYNCLHHAMADFVYGSLGVNGNVIVSVYFNILSNFQGKI